MLCSILPPADLCVRLDWNTPQIISMNNVANRDQIEFQHIFPQDFLKDKYPEFISERRRLLTNMLNDYLKELD